MKATELPNSDVIERALKRERYKKRFRKTLKSTTFALITAAAVAVLIATLWLPVLQIFGSSMTPTLEEGQIVLSVKVDEIEQGDIIAFYYGNRVLVKRCIAGPGSWLEMLPDGSFYVDGVALEEPYLTEKAYGSCDLEFPYQVPDGAYFLVGDMRESSVDSRHSSVGCISKDEIIEKSCIACGLCRILE